jgi:hypothetical protein
MRWRRSSKCGVVQGVDDRASVESVGPRIRRRRLRAVAPAVVALTVATVLMSGCGTSDPHLGSEVPSTAVNPAVSLSPVSTATTTPSASTLPSASSPSSSLPQEPSTVPTTTPLHSVPAQPVPATATSPSTSPTTSTTPSTIIISNAPTPAANSIGAAEQMLDAAVLPAGASPIVSLPDAVFSEPGQSIACTPLVDETSYWEIPVTAQAVAAFLVANAPSWIPNTLSGSAGNANGGTTSLIVGDSVRGSGWNPSDQLVFVVADLGSGSAGLRVDAEVVPPGSACLSSG